MSRVEEPESFNVEFCLDCSYKHLTAIQDHLEDGVALSKSSEEREFLAGILQQIRDARKKVLDKLRENPKSEVSGECPTCAKSKNPSIPVECEGKKGKALEKCLIEARAP